MKCSRFSILLWIALLPVAHASEPIPITILHTNDIHSHFRPERTPLALGGIARIKTAMDRIRQSTPNTLVVDGGDWSEGSAYYTLGAGRESLRMMDQLGYDVAVVGNHDWLNGPDRLLDNIESVNPRVALVGANIATAQYARGTEFREHVAPYVIREIGGLKVAFIGLVTYEFIYDSFFSPIGITEPFRQARELAAELKKSTDVVIAISHNSIKTNLEILKDATDIDLIIGAHDHVKLTTPIHVERPGAAPGWIVETGCWGRFLGRVDLRVTPRDASQGSHVKLVRYQLEQMDSTVAEDPTIVHAIDHLENLIEAEQGPIFHDHVADSEMDVGRTGVETQLGDLAADAFREATGADIAFDAIQFLYYGIPAGPLRTVDILNSIPAIYNPRTHESWTLHLLSMKGRTIQWLLNLLFSSQATTHLALATSGLEFIYDPAFTTKHHSEPLGPPGFEYILEPSHRPDHKNVLPVVTVGGEPLDLKKTYQVAFSGGILAGFRFLDDAIPDAVPLDHLRDTGIEAWRTLMDHIKKISPLTPDKIDTGMRIRTLGSDLGLYPDDVTWESLASASSASGTLSVHGKLTATIHNFGARPSVVNSRQAVRVLLNRNGANYAVDPDYETAESTPITRSLAPGATATFTWEVSVPEDRGVLPITVSLSGTEDEIDSLNDEVTVWVKAL